MGRSANRDAAKALERVYAKVPRIDCQGLCHTSCGPIPMSMVERERLERNPRVKVLPSMEHWTCPQLFEGRCQIHRLRPLICRLWGVTEGMPCVYGCKPTRVLSDAEAHRLLREIEELSREAR